MIYISVDPGKKKPSWCIETGSGISFHAKAPEVVPGCVCFVEGQYTRPKSGKESLMTLAKAAGRAEGYLLGKGCVVYSVAPAVWRDALLAGKGKIAKQVYHNHAKRLDLIPGDIWIRSEDDIDAYLQLQAGKRLLLRNPGALTQVFI